MGVADEWTLIKKNTTNIPSCLIGSMNTICHGTKSGL